MLPKGILFDLDDTIVSFAAGADPAWRSVCEEYASGSNVLSPDKLYDAIYQVRKWYWSDKGRHKVGRNNLDTTRRKIVSLAFEALGINDIALAYKIADSYSKKSEHAVHFFPKAEDTLKRLVDQGVSLALMTNGDSQKQRSKVDRFGLDRFFETILIEGELGYGKPEEAVYSQALASLALNPADVWAVGDNLEWDVSGPQKFGIFGIWNDFKRSGLPSSSEVIPDRIINNISELIE